MDDYLEKELRKPSLIKNSRVLDLKYIPKKLIHRDKEQKMLIQYFKPVLVNPGEFSQQVSIIGSVGTGKTAMALKFGEMVKVYTTQKNLNLEYVHVNCRRARSAILTLLEIVRKFNPNIPIRGYSPEEILQKLIEILNRKDLYLIVTLDEIDFVIRKDGPNLLYNLTRITDEEIIMKERISLITIVRDRDFRSMLDDGTQSTLRHNTIFLEPYTESQIRDIITDRTKEAFFEDIVSQEAIDLIADIASKSGDARYSIELLERAGIYADQKQALRVLPEHVRHANASSDPTLRQEIVNELTEQQKLILLAIAKQLQKTHKAYTTIEKVVKTYQKLCREYGLPTRNYIQLRENIQFLQNCDIISIKEHYGNITQICLSKVSSDKIEKTISDQLEKLKEIDSYIETNITDSEIEEDIKSLLKDQRERSFFDMKKSLNLLKPESKVELIKDIIALVNSAEQNNNFAYLVIGIEEKNQKIQSIMGVKNYTEIEQKIGECLEYININPKFLLSEISIFKLYNWQEEGIISDEIPFTKEQKNSNNKDKILAIQFCRESFEIYEISKKIGKLKKGQSWYRRGSHTYDLTHDVRKILMKS